MGLNVIILAAGHGKRMVSDQPKVMHQIGGISMLERVVNTVSGLKPDAIHVVYGNGGNTLPEHFSYLPVNWVRQEQQLGTGHAVLQAVPFCKPSDQVVIVYGDVPLISIKTLRKLIKETPKNGVGIVVTELDDPTGFGRIVRNEMGNVIEIVEQKDCNQRQALIHEINTGIMNASAKDLQAWLPALKNTNAQHEYYLTDVIHMAVETGHPVGGVMAHCHEEVQGVNDRWQLANLEHYFQVEVARGLCEKGVTIMDPARFTARAANIKVKKDSVIDVDVVFEGKVSIGSNCTIGAGVHLKDTVLADNVTVLPHSHIDGAKLDTGCVIGPFARVRPGTKIATDAKVGNFVELKKTQLGAGSKASHLSYLGDAKIGKNVNIGAGTITCNYDGVNKFKTEIADEVFVGSNTALVAPVKIQKGAMIAAGSTITEDVASNLLAIARARQVNKKRRKK